MLEAPRLVPERSVLLLPGFEPLRVVELSVFVVVEHTAVEALVVAHIRFVHRREPGPDTQRHRLAVDTVAELVLLQLE